MNKLFFLTVTDHIIEQQKLYTILSLVSNEKQEMVKRFHFEIDRKLNLYSELLVRSIACQTLGIKNTDIVFEREEYGKPYIKDYPDFYYNVSHTRNALVVAIADNPIGIDIEKIGRVEYGIVQRFFTLAEQTYFGKEDSEKDKRFYEVWTKKEAYIKYLGKGMSLSLNSFDTLSPDIAMLITTLQKDGYIITLCSEEPDLRFEMIELTEDELEDMVAFQSV